MGSDHLSVAKTNAQIGAVYYELSDYDEAISILSEAERHQLSSVGEDHRDTLDTQALVGRVLSATGEFDSALVKLRDVVEKQAQMFGSNHPSIADTNQYIAECFLNRGMVSEARALFVGEYCVLELKE